MEPGVITKTLVRIEGELLKPIEVMKRYRRYLKLGAFIGARTRVSSGRILEPGTIVQDKG